MESTAIKGSKRDGIHKEVGLKKETQTQKQQTWIWNPSSLSKEKESRGMREEIKPAKSVAVFLGH